MSEAYAPILNWPPRQPWRMVRRKPVLLHPDTRQPFDVDAASGDELDRMWAALHAWEHRHAGTLIGDRARQLRHDLVETEDTARRAQRLATTRTEIAA